MMMENNLEMRENPEDGEIGGAAEIGQNFRHCRGRKGKIGREGQRWAWWRRSGKRVIERKWLKMVTGWGLGEEKKDQSGRTTIDLVEAKRETRDPVEVVENSYWLGFGEEKKDQAGRIMMGLIDRWEETRDIISGNEIVEDG
jgi:hypothetical protein